MAHSRIAGLLLITAEPVSKWQSATFKLYKKSGGRKQAEKDFHKLKPEGIIQMPVSLSSTSR